MDRLEPKLAVKWGTLPLGPHSPPCRALLPVWRGGQQGSLEVLPASAMTRETFLMDGDYQSGRL